MWDGEVVLGRASLTGHSRRGEGSGLSLGGCWGRREGERARLRGTERRVSASGLERPDGRWMESGAQGKADLTRAQGAGGRDRGLRLGARIRIIWGEPHKGRELS